MIVQKHELHAQQTRSIPRGNEPCRSHGMVAHSPVPRDPLDSSTRRVFVGTGTAPGCPGVFLKPMRLSEHGRGIERSAVKGEFLPGRIASCSSMGALDPHGSPNCTIAPSLSYVQSLNSTQRVGLHPSLPRMRPRTQGVRGLQSSPAYAELGCWPKSASTGSVCAENYRKPGIWQPFSSVRGLPAG